MSKVWIRDRLSADTVEVVPFRYGRMMVLNNDRYIGAALKRYGEYSEAEVDLWRQLISDKAHVADIGANMGSHTVALASIVTDGAVFAFEPIRSIYHILCGNIALNGLANVQAFHAAVGAEGGTILVPSFDMTADENYGGIALGGWDKGNAVPMFALDEVLPIVHFIKIDVEGMELAVLAGAKRLIRECRPGLYLECNPEDGHDHLEGPTQKLLIRTVQEMGYDVWWHFPTHHNQDNFNGQPARNDHELAVVSYNILCLPTEGKHEIRGLLPIEAP